jgi:SAM-dependent methyltransferase
VRQLLLETPFGRNVTIIDWPDEPGQLAAYEHYIDHFRDRFEWTAFIDLDEFIHVLDGQKIGTLLRDCEQFSAILLQWLIFGPSGWEQSPPGLVIDNYIWRIPEDDPGNLHVKTLARNATLIRPDATPHTFGLLGPVCNSRGQECSNKAIQDVECHVRAVINHYFTKSKQDWVYKRRKGKATTTKADEQYPLGMFDYVGSRAMVRDERIRSCARGLKQALYPHSLSDGLAPPDARTLLVAAPRPTSIPADHARNGDADLMLDRSGGNRDETQTERSMPASIYPDQLNADLLHLIPLGAHTVLDVGCGTGALGVAYRELNRAARVLGIERDPAAASIAVRRLDETSNADVEIDPLPFDLSDGIDCIIYGDVLRHLRDPWGTMRRQIKALRPGGTVLISVPDVQHWSLAARLSGDRRDYQPAALLDAGHLRCSDLGTIVCAVQDAGLTVQEVRHPLLEPEQAHRFVETLAPELGDLGIAVEEYRRRTAPHQYVIRCTYGTSASEAPHSEEPAVLTTRPLSGSRLASAQRPTRPCVFHNALGVHYGNMMIKYMAGLKLRRRVPDLILSNFSMPYWNLDHPPLPSRAEDTVVAAESEQHLDMTRIEYLIRAGLVHRVDWSGYGQRMENFADREHCRRVFSTPETDLLGDTFGDTDLICPIRGGEILDARHGGYTLLPAAFYRDIADRLGLRPVFVGQLGDNVYVDSLHQALPDALYVTGCSPMPDFQTVRKARNIVVPISTFAWLAAWLSDAERIILPVYGLFNPLQFPHHDLLPLADERYTFYEFPVHWAVPVDRVLEAHKEILGAWRLTPPEKFIRI